jgi:hypothetical protein
LLALQPKPPSEPTTRVPPRSCHVTKTGVGSVWGRAEIGYRIRRAAQRKLAVFYPLYHGGLTPGLRPPLAKRTRFSIGNLFLRGA